MIIDQWYTDMVQMFYLKKAYELYLSYIHAYCHCMIWLLDLYWAVQVC